MKVTREKRVKRNLKYYKYNFGFREPYQLLIDNTFITAALNTNFDIKLQLKQYLQAEVKFLTTPCVIMECEKLGRKLYAVTNLAKTFALHKCGHEASPVSGAHCLKSMIKGNHYIVCTQDTDLQEWLRRRPGNPVMYLHGTAPVLEAASESSKEFISKKNLALIEKASNKQRLAVDRELRGAPSVGKITKRRAKAPNPLACKKKKKKPQSLQKQNQNK